MISMPENALYRDVALILLALLLLATTASAARTRSFYLERPRLALEFEYSYQDDENVTPTRTNGQVSHRFLEGLSLASRGYLYHPALLIFDLELSPSWEQEEQSSAAGREDSRRSFFFDYNLSGTLMQYRRLSLNFQARQSNSSTSNTLSATTSNESALYGATLVYKSLRLPTRLSYQYQSVNQQGFFSTTSNTERLTLTSNHRIDRSTTRLNADYSTSRYDSRGREQTADITRLSLSNNLNVTADRRVNLGSTATAFWRENADQTSNEIDLQEDLTWQHTQPDKRLQFSSSYAAGYTARRENGDVSETIPLTVGATLSHRLYDNLRSSLSGSSSYTRFAGGHQKTYGGGPDFDYTRRIPGGELNLNLGGYYEIDDRVSTQELIDVIDEAVTLSAFSQTLLANRNIDLDSIQVFSADKSQLYQRDFDYTLSPVGSFVEIERVFLDSAITEGETVLVSYRYQSDPSAKIATIDRYFGAGLTLGSVFRLRYRLSLTQEDVRAGLPPDTLADDTIQNVSAQVSLGWSDTRLTLDDEKRAAGNSIRRWKIDQGFSWRPRSNLALGVGGGYGESELLDTGGSGWSSGLNASLQWQLQSNQQWRMELFQNINESESDTQTTRTESTGLGVFYVWRYALWSVEADYRYRLDEQPVTDQKRTLNSFDLRLRRALY